MSEFIRAKEERQTFDIDDLPEPGHLLQHVTVREEMDPVFPQITFVDDREHVEDGSVNSTLPLYRDRFKRL